MDFLKWPSFLSNHTKSIPKLAFVFLHLGKSSSTDLPDEIAKELEVLSGFNTDSNPPNIEILPDSQLSSIQDSNVIPQKNPSRIGTQIRS